MFLKAPMPSQADLANLDPDINEAKLNVVSEYLAGFVLELYAPEFPCMGTFRKNLFGRWLMSPTLTGVAEYAIILGMR